MRDTLENLSQAARQRHATRHAFDSRVAQVKADLAARGVGGRIADQAVAEAKATAFLGLDVAKESKGIIAATGGLLALWFLRAPILAWLDRTLATNETEIEDNEHD